MNCKEMWNCEHTESCLRPSDKYAVIKGIGLVVIGALAFWGIMVLALSL